MMLFSLTSTTEDPGRSELGVIHTFAHVLTFMFKQSRYTVQ
jgi:hypothetical protein